MKTEKWGESIPSFLSKSGISDLRFFLSAFGRGKLGAMFPRAGERDLQGGVFFLLSHFPLVGIAEKGAGGGGLGDLSPESLLDMDLIDASNYDVFLEAISDRDQISPDDPKALRGETSASEATGQQEPEAGRSGRATTRMPLELIDSIRNFVESKGHAHARKERSEGETRCPALIYGATLDQIREFLKREHETVVSRSSIHRLMTPANSRRANASRHSEVIDGRTATLRRDEKIHHPRQHFACASIKMAEENLAVKAAEGESVLQINVDDFRAIPSLLDGFKIKPSGFYLEGDYPHLQDHDFVLRHRLLLRASGYSVSKFSSGEEAKATFQDKLGRKHFAGPGAKRMHVKVRD